SPHPVETNIFVFRTLWDNGYQSYAHFSDIVALDILKGMVTNDVEAIGVSAKFYNKVKKDYLSPTDLKKLDIGGGMIHGNANDFTTDKSTKIILSHTAKKLTVEQKEIGSDAHFGMIDQLIPSNKNYEQHYAKKYLLSYFPNAPLHDVNILLNCPIVDFNPGSILFKKGAVNENFYLILTGSVEVIRAESGNSSLLSSGSLVGELSGLIDIPLAETCRAVSFITALQIPNRLYLEFVKRNHLYRNIERIHDSRNFLQNTWIFGERVSYPIQNKIAQAMTLNFYSKEEELPVIENKELRIVQKGELQICTDNQVIDILRPGDFYGEETILFGIPSFFNIRSVGMSKVYHVPGEILLDIPMVQWKLLETMQRRMEILGNHLY
ncbi:MAG: hemerythrin, partial [bacterium]